jgi:aminopeptidase N
MQRLNDLLRLVVIGCVFVTHTALHAETPFNFETGAGHLPRAIVPSHYTVRIAPDLLSHTFTGHVRTEITVRETVDTIVMNAADLTIDAAAIHLDADATPVSLDHRLDPETQQLSLLLDNPLAPGTYSIELTYRGVINSNPEGFFYDRYLTDDGERQLFGTQMEVPDARRVLPCWDEPAFKATFDSTLVVPAHFVVSSNMPALREVALDGNRKAVTFARTPRMSTYLLAYFGGEFEILETQHRGVTLRILATQGKRDQGAYALEVTTQVLDYFADYFGVAYPLPKLDQVAIPNAFSNFGAMENWGSIAYVENLLLYDPASSAQATKENAFSVIAHEIAHQWFGNLVTMGWWDNLWLNEGFASWMATKATNDLNPDWKVWVRANSSKESAFNLDARASTHPIQLPGVTEMSAIDAFDAISYQKGQAFVRMLENYLGAEPFRDGIRRYMQRHAYSNTTTADLWNALAEASQQPVAQIAAAWTEQPAFPIITATLADEKLTLSQQRFSLDDPHATPLQWTVPLSIAPLEQLDRPSSHLLFPGETLTLPWSSASGPPKLNVNDAGYYRVLYDEDTRTALIDALPHLPEAEQLNLLGDTWALVQTGRLSTPDYLKVTLALRDSTSQPVWNSILNALATIDVWLWRDPSRDSFQRWVVTLLRPQLDRLGWEIQPGESPLVDTLRTGLIYRLGRCGDRAVIAECQARFRRYRQEPDSLTGGLRSSVLAVVGRYADPRTYEQLSRLAISTTSTEEKGELYDAMQHALDPTLARQTLELTHGEQLPTTIRNWNIMSVAGSGEHLDLAWDFTQQHAAELLAPLAAYGANSYLGYVVRNSSNPMHADQLEALSLKLRGEASLPEVRKTSGLIRLRATIRAREIPLLRAWLDQRLPPSN